MLLLFYAELSLIYGILTLSIDFVKSWKWLYDELVNYNVIHVYKVSTAIITIVLFLFSFGLFIVLHMFHAFHRRIVKENKTTIENLEHKNDDNYVSRYDIDPHFNYRQVMGTVRWLTWFPIMPKYAKPKGDGIYFDKNSETEDSEEEGDEENTGNNEDSRNQRNSRRDNNGVQPQPAQNTSNQAVERPSQEQLNNRQTVTRQGDVMTIHNARNNQYQNLNNIVRSENPAQEFKSSETEDNQAAFTRGSQYSRKQFVNEMTGNEYEELK